MKLHAAASLAQPRLTAIDANGQSGATVIAHAGLMAVPDDIAAQERRGMLLLLREWRRRRRRDSGSRRRRDCRVEAVAAEQRRRRGNTPGEEGAPARVLAVRRQLPRRAVPRDSPPAAQ